MQNSHHPTRIRAKRRSESKFGNSGSPTCGFDRYRLSKSQRVKIDENSVDQLSRGTKRFQAFDKGPELRTPTENSICFPHVPAKPGGQFSCDEPVKCRRPEQLY